MILADFAARLLVSRNRLREFTRFSTWTDVVAIVSFLAPLAGEGGGFLRILRTLRLLRDYQMLARLRVDSAFFRRNEEVIFAVTNLAVFIFVMTAIVYETQKFRNDQITNYADALYFTVTALTTTGFGDITLPGTVGRLISVVDHDLRRHPVLQSRPRAADPDQSAVSLPDLRPAAPRQRRRALQGVRLGAEYSRRGPGLAPARWNHAQRSPVPLQRWHFTTLSPFFSRPLPSQFLHFCFFLMLGPFWLDMTISGG